MTPAGALLLLTVSYFRLFNVAGTIAAGPDGNLWFPLGDGVARMTPAGVVTAFPLGHANPARSDIAAGPDGRMWFTEPRDARVAAVTMEGAITEYALPAGTALHGIAAGADGNVWIGTNGSIARMTPSGGLTIFPLAGHSEVFGLVAGSDGNVWFVEWPRNVVGRITPAGVITEFDTSAVCCSPEWIASDGKDLLISFSQGGVIARMATSGALTATTHPGGIYATIAGNGPDGALWFVSEQSAPPLRLGRLDPDGSVTLVPLDPSITAIFGVAAGPDGNVWATLWPPPVNCTLICPPPDPTPPLAVARVNLRPPPPRRRAVTH